MINLKQAIKFCCEDISTIEGYNEAMADQENIWHCHHKLGLYFDKQWLIDKGLYYDQRAEMLVFIKQYEHLSLHKSGNKNNKGKKFTTEHKQKISESLKGKNVSEVTRQKIGDVRRGIYNTKSSRNVYQYAKDGAFVAEFPSVSEAQRQLGISQGHISLCCYGKRKTAGGFIWSYSPLSYPNCTQ